MWFYSLSMTIYNLTFNVSHYKLALQYQQLSVDIPREIKDLELQTEEEI